MKRLSLIFSLLLVQTFSVSAADVFVSLADFGQSAITNRTVLVTGSSLPRGQSSSVIVQDKRKYTTGSTGTFWISNAVAGVYFFEVQAPPARTEFRILVEDTTNTVYAATNIVASAANTLPPDTVSYGTRASDLRYWKRSDEVEATHATNADSASNATNLNGLPASAYATRTNATLVGAVLQSADATGATNLPLTGIEDAGIGHLRLDRLGLMDIRQTGVDRKVYVYRPFAASSTETHFAVPFGNNYLADWIESNYSTTGVTNFYGVWIGVPVICDTNGTRSGTWSTGNNADCFGGRYWHASTTNDTWTSVVSGSRLFVRYVHFGNNGFGFVEIDGSKTNANRCPAVTQAMIDAGAFTQDQLGYRFYDTYNNYIPVGDSWQCLADNLTDGPHTVVLRPTGTKRPESSDVRMYVTAVCGGGALTSLLSTNAAIAPLYEPTYGHSSTESQFAITPVLNAAPTGGTLAYMGSTHGNESNATNWFTVDGVVTNLSSGQVVCGNEIVHFHRSSLNNTDQTNLFTQLTTVRFSATANVQAELVNLFTANYPGTCDVAYAGMWSISTKTRTPYPGNANSFIWTNDVYGGCSWDYSAASKPHQLFHSEPDVVDHDLGIKSLTGCFFSSHHDFVLAMQSNDTTVWNTFSDPTTYRYFYVIEDRPVSQNAISKLYIASVNYFGGYDFSPGWQVWTRVGMKILNIPDAATRLNR